MSDTDSMMQRFRGPTPPPAIDRKVMQAAQQKAASLGPRLSGEAEMSYSKQSKTTKSTEQTTMSDNIVFPCPACGTKYSVSPHHAGKKTTCKKCSAQVTVPTPQVANPTIVGGTRTIRRADIDPGASAREEAVEKGAHSDVDMTGGASVLRKEETVIGAPPMHATSVPTRGPGRRPTAGPRPAPQPHGRPMPYGAPGVPAKKNNMPMLLGIGGGVLGLILLIVIIVVASSSGNTNSNTAGPSDGEPTVAADPDKKLLEDHRKAYNNKDGLTLPEVRGYYLQAAERKDKADWKSMRDIWVGPLVEKVKTTGTSADVTDIALMLDDAKIPEGRALLDHAWQRMNADGKATVSTKDENGRNVQRPNQRFLDIVKRLGWAPYSRPTKMDECQRLETRGAREYSDAYNSIEQVYHDVELYPPAKVSELKKLEEQAFAGYEELVTADDDSKKSREAWIRFKIAQAGGKKVMKNGVETRTYDRAKGKRSFSPGAMDRDDESIDQIWTYTYGPAFMVFVERPIGQDDLDEEFIETLESKKALLTALHKWFSEHLITPYGLKRVKPKDNAERAELEKWPMQIVVLKDRATFEKYALDVIGSPMPGARAFYSPLDEGVMTYDDSVDNDPDAAWFNESVLIHETFHMLSDFYAANPMFAEDEMRSRPRYSSILVQEGLTDSVGGFVRDGVGGSSTYDFMKLNHLRLREFKLVYDLLGKNLLYRIRDAVDCRNYGQCQQKALDRVTALGLKVNRMWLVQNVALSAYYATTCQISYFFQYYTEGGKAIYRDKWWEYVGMDYKGEMKLNSFQDNSAIAKFKDVFGIKTDKDWDTLEKKFLDYTLALKEEDVGKGAADFKETEGGEGDDKEESIRPGIPPMPGFGNDSGEQSALPGREDEALEELEEALVG